MNPGVDIRLPARISYLSAGASAVFPAAGAVYIELQRMRVSRE
jgi:hypothetical protein